MTVPKFLVSNHPSSKEKTKAEPGSCFFGSRLPSFFNEEFFFPLSVKSIPKHLEDSDTMRMLLVGVYNGSPYMCDNCLAYGDKQKILATLDDPTLPQNILSRLPKMASDLNAD